MCHATEASIAWRMPGMDLQFSQLANFAVESAAACTYDGKSSTGCKQRKDCVDCCG